MGFFSWFAQDTGRSISNRHSSRGPLIVYMVDPTIGKKYPEEDYDGYGVFGGKDFYVLVAELNHLQPAADEADPHEALRLAGIRFACEQHVDKKGYISPILVEDPDRWKEFKGQTPEDDPAQGFFYPNEDTPERVYRYENDVPADSPMCCEGCGIYLGGDAKYLHRFAGDGSEAEWLCADCAAQLLGESLNEHNSIEYMG